MKIPRLRSFKSPFGFLSLYLRSHEVQSGSKGLRSLIQKVEPTFDEPLSIGTDVTASFRDIDPYSGTEKCI